MTGSLGDIGTTQGSNYYVPPVHAQMNIPAPGLGTGSGTTQNPFVMGLGTLGQQFAPSAPPAPPGMMPQQQQQQRRGLGPQFPPYWI